jgi:hypothetical protein
MYVRRVIRETMEPRGRTRDEGVSAGHLGPRRQTQCSLMGLAFLGTVLAFSAEPATRVNRVSDS